MHSVRSVCLLLALLCCGSPVAAQMGAGTAVATPKSPMLGMLGRSVAGRGAGQPALGRRSRKTPLGALPVRRTRKAARAASLALEQVSVGGKQYYRTYRVCSSERAQGMLDDKTRNRQWTSHSGNVWQYGSGFYLFTSLKDAKRYISCSRDAISHLLVKKPSLQVKARETIVEVLLPKERFDGLRKARVNKRLDWAPTRQDGRAEELKQLRRGADVVFGAWREDPQLPLAANRPMQGTQQLAIVNTGQGSVLNDAVVRLVGKGGPQRVSRAPSIRAHRSPAPEVKGARALPWSRRFKLMSSSYRTRHAGLHRLLDAPVTRQQGRKAVSYLMQNFNEARAYFPRESGNWEGRTIKSHTERVYNNLAIQLRHVDLDAMQQRYPGVNLKRTLQLALLTHDLGKPLAIDKARYAVDQTLAAGRSLAQMDRSGIKTHHARYSKHFSTRMMLLLGCSRQEVKLARALVGSEVLGELAQGHTSVTRAAGELKTLARRNGMHATDYFTLQKLFYTADAGAYRSLRKIAFTRHAGGRLEPLNSAFDMVQLNLSRAD